MKVKLLIWSIFVLVAVLPIRQTISLYQNYLDLRNEASTTPSLPPQAEVKRNIFQVDIDRQLFEIFTIQDSKGFAKLVKMNPSHRIDENEFVSTYTKEVTLEGNFRDILSYLSESESRLGEIKIASLTFSLLGVRQHHNLRAMISFQSVKLNSYE
jgi:hypothetical protein